MGVRGARQAKMGRGVGGGFQATGKHFSFQEQDLGFRAETQGASLSGVLRLKGHHTGVSLNCRPVPLTN